MKLTKYLASGLVLLAMTACSDVDIPATPDLPKVADLLCEATGRNVTLNWTLPSGTTPEAIEIYRNNKLVESLPGDATSYTISRETAGQENLYTVKLRYPDDLLSQGVSVAYTIDAPAPVPAMFIPVASVDMLTDDDEIAAARWFAETYPQGKILTENDLDELDPFNYHCVWINIDREDLDYGVANLPQAVRSEATVKAMKAYIADGGNLFLTKHATQLTVTYGFIAEKYAPGIFGSGQGGDGDDNWAMNANIGLGTYDHRSHDIFRGLTTIPDYGHETFALEGPGHREDHNCMWDFNAYGLIPSPNAVATFERYNKCTVLATWAHVVDFAVGGILEFQSTATRPGRCIAIGLAAYEFNQNTGNPFQANIERLSKNCIDYLK